MIILFWIIGILVIACLIGEIRFRQLRVLRSTNKRFNIGKWTDSIDKDMDVLDIEFNETEFVPTTKLAMRGSWRLAQDSIMSTSDFAEIRDCEYSKCLH